ncbi:MAG TPA: hypothetical protein VI564_07105 [Candidatus Nanoarchaeia archaeon]|nr:hypothetical protein [Candidatus Nanoarchaeia archaeon]
MPHHGPNKCPICHRDLTEDELYCYFCELEVSKMKKEHGYGHDDSHSKGHGHH